MSSQFKKTAQKRTLILSVILSLWCVGIVARLIDLQILRHGELLDKALRQQQHVVNTVPRRGAIFDRQHRELAISVDVDSLATWGSQIKDPRAVAMAIAPILRFEPHEIETRLSSTRGFLWIQRKLEKPQADAIRAMNIKGLEFIRESKRFYPKRELAAQVLGYVGLDNEGLGGVEHFYDKRIKGTPGWFSVQVDARRHRFARQEGGRSNGDDIILTIDENIQYIAQKALDDAMGSTRSEAGTAIVMNPRTGEILAMANSPGFNPNSYRASDPETWKNRSMQSIYEPGSVFKIVTVAAALEEGLTIPDEVIDCQMGGITLAGHAIHDHEKLGLLTVTQIIEKSSDVGAIKLGLRLGEERFHKYIRAFGFGSPTGIDLPGEARGIARDPSHWSKISVGAISMGQEIGATPLQVLRAMATIANDGVSTRPFVAQAIMDPSGKWVMANTPQDTRVLSARTAVTMKKILEGVILQGTGRKAKLDGYTAAGKTGTAQKIDPQTGRYFKDKYVASFAGFTPVNNPEVAIIVALDSPAGALHQGGQVAAPAWRQIAEQTLRYLNIPPELPLMQVARKIPKSISNDAVSDFESNDTLEDTNAQSDLARVASSPAPAQTNTFQPLTHSPSAGETRVAEEKVFRATANMVTVPGLVGKSLREAALECQQAGVGLGVVGSGFVVAQDPPAGTLVPHQSKVAAKFARSYSRIGF
jgi:cell division protein FtsI (penicillin-binding protein 3)